MLHSSIVTDTFLVHTKLYNSDISDTGKNILQASKEKEKRQVKDNRRYIYWSLPLIPSTEFLKPFNLPSDKSTRSIFIVVLKFVLWP